MSQLDLKMLNKMKTKIISIDFQKDFTAEGGICHKPRPSVDFVKNTLVPYLTEKKIKIAEIISDYRQPRPGGRGNCCRPGEWGYESEIPESAKENIARRVSTELL